jgi:hypothetical protein
VTLDAPATADHEEEPVAAIIGQGLAQTAVTPGGYSRGSTSRW